jgi:anti-anti-sigma factor
MEYPESLDAYGLLRGRLDNLNGTAGYALSGELDLASADVLRRRLSDLSDQAPGDLWLDLADLDFLGSTGIGALRSIHATLADKGRRLVLLNVSGAPYRALEITDLVGTLHIG